MGNLLNFLSGQLVSVTTAFLSYLLSIHVDIRYSLNQFTFSKEISEKFNLIYAGMAIGIGWVSRAFIFAEILKC